MKCTTRTMVQKINRGLGAVVAILLLSAMAQSARAQDYRFSPEHRRPVEATMHDLEEIGARNTYNGHERERYDAAIGHLQQFSDRLHEGGHFDKGKLDQAIGDVQRVLDRNKMMPQAHEVLARDVMELRRLRQHFDDRYRYPY